MKKLIILLSVIPSLAFAQTFDRDLYLGIQKDSDVTMLQEFLTEQGVYSGPISGNFFSLTLQGVKAFQTKQGISPTSGYFGPKSRSAANQILGAEGVSSTGWSVKLELGANPGSGSNAGSTEYKSAAQGLDLQSLEVRGPSPDLERVFQAAHNQRRNAFVVIASPLIRFYQKQSWISRLKTDCRAWAKAVCLQMPVLLLLTDRILTQVIVVLPTLSIEFSTARKPADLPVEQLSLEFFGCLPFQLFLAVCRRENFVRESVNVKYPLLGQNRPRKHVKF